MTQAEKDILLAIVQHMEVLTVRVDALEGSLIARRLIRDGEAGSLEANYVQAARNDLASIRSQIAFA